MAFPRGSSRQRFGWHPYFVLQENKGKDTIKLKEIAGQAEFFGKCGREAAVGLQQRREREERERWEGKVGGGERRTTGPPMEATPIPSLPLLISPGSTLCLLSSASSSLLRPPLFTVGLSLHFSLLSLFTDFFFLIRWVALISYRLFGGFEWQSVGEQEE